MPTALTGVVDDNILLQNQRIIDMNPVIQQLEMDAAPLTTMLQKLGAKPAFSQKVEWLEDELLPRLTAVAGGGYLVGAASVVVTTGTGQYFRVRDVVQNARTGENMLVTAVVTDTLSVQRAIGSVAAAAGNAGDDFLRLGNAAYEGSTLGVMKQTKKVAQFNYCQIQRNPWGFTNTLIASKLYGGPALGNEAQKKMIEHKRDIENTMFFGRRSLDTTTGAVTGYCGGLIDYIATNITNIAGNLTQVNFETFLRQAFRFGSREKNLYAAPLLVSALASFPLGAVKPTDLTIDKWGIKIAQYQSAQGDLVNIYAKRDWFDFATTSTQYGGYGFLVDPANITMRELRNTQLKPNRQAPDEDSEKQEFLTEYSLEINLERTHAIIKGVTGY